ncbi:DUF2784 domain-containing protein [Nocardia camponoti]|uniref:DUF2784 domain-containing protein n=1 Tax=Nocardia camponoti TaxID=1616106 RepID=A0A917V3J6_9NOCA|nr:DUF2784 domain-containing protein [Nocardia camponoti]GGK34773.1 hypothetical protein GCM10011591_03010 [Nocardia camponoti]
MLYRGIVDVVAATHFAFIAYVVVGGFLAWRFPRTIWGHLVAVGWGFGTILVGFHCPLTYAENWARRGAGMPELPDGFIAHYLTGVLYPASALGTVRLVAAGCVVVSWVGYAVLAQRHRRVGSEAV